MARFAHVSDIHVTASPLGWSLGDWTNKRLTTWLNLKLRRGKFFRRADDVMAALERDRRERGIERVVFSGDATCYGFPSEIERAAEFLGVGRGSGLAVPGNHDYLIRSAEASGVFERAFALWQQGVRIDEHVYPFAQPMDDGWLVAVNSARGNRFFWDASGAVGIAQTERLSRLLAQLSPGPRILVTHYPIALKNGDVEGKSHGLNDLANVLTVAQQGGVSLWLHGHRHGFYVLPDAAKGIPAICIGSSTQKDKWSYGDYEISGGRLSAVRREYDEVRNVFRDGESFTLKLATAAS